MSGVDSPTVPVADREELGRIISSRDEAKRAMRTEKAVLVPCFLPRRGESRLSVDRLSKAPLDAAAANGERVAQARQRGILRTTGRPSRDIHFCGWVVISAYAARTAGCSVEATPIEGNGDMGNPYHADIVLPKIVETDDEERKEYAQQLALTARWEARPTVAFARSEISGI